jgi:hypothetical protein
MCGRSSTLLRKIFFLSSIAPPSHLVHSESGGLLTRDRQHRDPHDQPCRKRERLPLLAGSFDRREMGGREEFENVRAGLADPLGRKLAGGASRGHGALLAANASAIVPQRTPLAKATTP